MEIGRDAHGIKSLSRHFLEQVVALSSEGVLVVDAQDSSLPVVYANPAYEDLTGYSVAELAGRPWSMLRREADSEPELQRLKGAIGRSEAYRVTVADLHKDGSAWVVDVHVAPLANTRGETRYFVCVHKPAAAMAASAADTATVSDEPADSRASSRSCSASSDGHARRSRTSIASIPRP